MSDRKLKYDLAFSKNNSACEGLTLKLTDVDSYLGISMCLRQPATSNEYQIRAARIPHYLETT